LGGVEVAGARPDVLARHGLSRTFQNLQIFMSEPIWEITASVRQPVLEVSSRYGRIEVLHDVSVSVGKGRILSLIGANGAGKTTLLKTISGAQPTSSGSIVFDGKAVDRVRADLRVRLGLAQVPEGRQVSGALSVEDNLLLGGWTSSRENVSVDLDEAYSTFPILHEKRHLLAGSLSGGQQQMLAISCALMSRPSVVLLDGPAWDCRHC
jgi:branched-chain amino acid transport system ATP-binding protein